MNVSRRGFLAGTAAGFAGLTLSFYVPEASAKAAKKAEAPKPLPPPNAFVHIAPDDTVTVLLAHSEMGQGIWTGLAMLIAEELGADWSKMKAEHAPANVIYGHPLMGIQMTGGSASMYGEFDRYRTVGATAKDMLVRAAAARWKVAPGKLKVAAGVITDGKRLLRFGEVAEEAAKLEPAAKVTLKKPAEWKIIGTRVKRLDTPEKINGTALFGMDVQFPGLRTAVIARPPMFGGKLARIIDDSKAKAIAGVERVVIVEAGVAVVASNFWAAKRGRDLLELEWTPPKDAPDSAKLLGEYRKLAQKPGTIVTGDGSVEAAIKDAKTTVVAEYDVPYLSHSPMEPLNCAVKIDGDKVEVWTGTQMQGMEQMAAAKIAGTTPDKVTIHTMFLGGGFGRRATPASDFVSEAVMVAKATGLPIKTVWTREDDIRGGYYRPMFLHRMRAGIDAAGKPVGWDHTIVGQSIMAGTPFAGLIKNGIDEASVEGVATSPYLEPLKAKRVSLHSPTNHVSVLWWRSVGNTHTAFAMECMIDELAHAANKDPLEYRLSLLDPKSRHAAALKLVAEKAGWGKPPAEGRARGLAVHESFGSIMAECAEVSIEPWGNKQRIRVHEVTVAVDCGTAVNPLAVEAQIMGSVAFGLTAALAGKLDIVDGKTQQSNFHDYPILRMAQMPKINVHIINSGAKMGGIGEPATAPIAPAVGNAVFALTGQRLRSLPFVLGGAK